MISYKKIILSLLVLITSLSAETFYCTNELYGGIQTGDETEWIKPCFTDLEGDGCRDVLVGGIGYYSNYIYRFEEDSPGSNNYTLLDSYFCNINRKYCNPAIGDIDNDGKLDLLVGYEGDGNFSRVAHYEQTAVGSEAFNLVTDLFGNIWQDENDGFLAPWICDLENDGLYDVLIGTWAGRVLRYEQASPNSYTFNFIEAIVSTQLDSYFASPFLTDYNNDGLNDLLVGSRDEPVYHFLQDAVNSEIYSLASTNFGGISASAGDDVIRYYGDIDGNSYPDLLAALDQNAIEQWSLLPPDITTTNASNIQGYQVDTGVSVTDVSGLSYSSVGICWSTAMDPTLADDNLQLGTSPGTYNTTLTGLSNNTTYYLRGYSTDQYDTVYGNQISFTTSSTMTLNTTDVGSIFPTTARCGGWHIVNTSTPLTEVGVCYSTDVLPDKTDPHTSGTLDPEYDNFVHKMEGLQPSTKYYVRAFITNSVTTVYGEEKYFWTDTTPSLSTNTITGLSETAATSGGTFSSNGGDDITARGLCWNTTGNPTTADPSVNLIGGYYNFTAEATGLTPKTKYYIRSYATNGAGTGYGDEKSFKTFVADSVPGYCLNFDGTDDFISGTGIPTDLSEITIEAWIKHNDLPENGISRYVTVSPEVACIRYDGTQFGGYKALDFWVKKANGSLYHLISDSVLTENEWMHVVGTYDGSVMSLFLNGELLNYAVINGGLYPPDGNFTISKYSEPMNGLMDEVRLWNSARSVDEIRKNMHIPIKGTDAQIGSYWQFNEGTGGVLTDNAGIKNGSLNYMTAGSWTSSTLSFGKGESDLQIVSSTGPVTFGGTGAEFNITEQTGYDTLVVSKLDAVPNTVPAPVNEVFNSGYWIVRKYGSGDFTTDITLTIDEGLTTNDDAVPELVTLYSRGSNSDSEWTSYLAATTVNSGAGTVTFSGLTDFSQLIVARNNLGSPGNVTTEISGTDLILSWDPVTGASSYKIYSSDDPYGTFIEESVLPVGETWSIPFSESKKFYYIVSINGN